MSDEILLDETKICNMALGRIGSARLTDTVGYSSDTSVEAKLCRLFYPQIRDSLLRSHWWGFASKRANLKLADESPIFEWDHQYYLPDDFLRLKVLYDGPREYEIEHNGTGKQVLLTDEDTVSIKYIAKITYPPDFDILFTEVLITQLAIKLLYPIAGCGKGTIEIGNVLNAELFITMKKVRALDRQETDTMKSYISWNEARTTSGLNASDDSGDSLSG